jgi:hypothetical protein
MKSPLTPIIAVALSLASAGAIYPNGREVQREAVARVIAVDPQARTFEVEREFRGKVWRLILRVESATTIFTCEQAAATLDELRPGDLVSVYYEQVGREGLANLVVVEPRD